MNETQDYKRVPCKYCNKLTGQVGTVTCDVCAQLLGQLLLTPTQVLARVIKKNFTISGVLSLIEKLAKESEE